MFIQPFMENYKKAWETSDEFLLASLFTEDGRYHNTPFSVQAGHAQIRQYWQRTKLQADIALTFEILHADALSGIAHWHTNYQVMSEDMFAMWAASTGTTQLARKPGDPLPRLALDGVAVAEFEACGLCRDFRIGWHSVIEPEADSASYKNSSCSRSSNLGYSQISSKNQPKIPIRRACIPDQARDEGAEEEAGATGRDASHAISTSNATCNGNRNTSAQYGTEGKSAGCCSM